MRLLKPLAGLALVLLLGACAGTTPDIVRAGHQSFSFAQPLAVDVAEFPEPVREQLRRHVGAALSARGLLEQPEGGDLVVDVIAHVESIRTDVGIVNPDLTRIRRTSQPVLFTSRHIDGMEVRELRVDEGELKVLVRQPGSGRLLYSGRSSQRLRHIGLDNSDEVIATAVVEAFSRWPAD
ncbi:MAG: DUF4136 domain-containing protein [Lysobacteraceae bacterium]